MAPSKRRSQRVKRLGACLLVGLAAAGLWLLSAPPADRQDETTPVAAPAESKPDPSGETTRSQSPGTERVTMWRSPAVSVEMPALVPKLNALGRHLANPELLSPREADAPRKLLLRARAAELTATQFWRELEKLARDGGASGLLTLLTDELDPAEPELLHATARTLAASLDRYLVDRLLNAAWQASTERQAYLLTALGGSADPRVDRLFADLYCQSEEAAPSRRAVGFELGQPARLARLQPALRQRVVEAARADLAANDPEQWAVAADIVSARRLAPADRAWLIDQVRHGPLARRLASLRTLAASGQRLDSLRGLFQDLSEDPATPAELRQIARELVQLR